MPDDGNQQNSPPEPAAPQPAAPPTPPVSPPGTLPSKSALPEVSPDTPFRVPMADGTEQVVTLGELAESFRTGAATPPVDPEQLKKYELFEKATTGDVEALQELFQSKLPAVAEGQDGAAAVATPELQQVQEQVKNMQGVLDQVRPVVDQIATARSVGMFRTQIETHKESVPYLAQHPNGAEIANGIWDQFRAIAMEQKGIDLANHPRASAVFAASMKQADTQIRNDFSVYSNIKAPTSTPIQAVDDQAATDQAGVGSPPHGAVGVVNGVWVDSRGNAVQGAAPAVSPTTLLPTGGVAPATGTSVLDAGDRAPAGPMDEASLMARMTARGVELAGTP